MLDIVGGILGPIIAELAKIFAAPGVAIEKIQAAVEEFFELIFKIDFPNITKEFITEFLKKHPVLASILPFLLLVKCLLIWFIKFLNPDLILGLFFPSGVPETPDITVLSYTPEYRFLKIDDQKKSIIFEDTFAIDEKIRYTNAKTEISYDVYIQEIRKAGVVIKENLIAEHEKDDNGSGIIKKL